VYSNARLFLEIEKTDPDVVVMDLDLYAKIDGIETSREIRSQFDVPVWYV
jgi:chemotaxis response regulator CheB